MTTTKHPSCIPPDKFNVDNPTGLLTAMRRQIDDLWAMARDAVRAPEDQEWTDHETSITKAVFESLQLVSMVETYVEKMRIAQMDAERDAGLDAVKASLEVSGQTSEVASTRRSGIFTQASPTESKAGEV